MFRNSHTVDLCPLDMGGRSFKNDGGYPWGGGQERGHALSSRRSPWPSEFRWDQTRVAAQGQVTLGLGT